MLASVRRDDDTMRCAEEPTNSQKVLNQPPPLVRLLFRVRRGHNQFRAPKRIETRQAEGSPIRARATQHTGKNKRQHDDDDDDALLGRIQAGHVVDKIYSVLEQSENESVDFLPGSALSPFFSRSVAEYFSQV